LVPTAPFYEHAVMRRVRQWLKNNLGRHVRVRHNRGGLIVSYNAAGKTPALVLAAHLDHPAFHLITVNPDGATARLLGGLPPHLLPGARVEAFAGLPRDNVPLANGVIQSPPDKKSGLWSIRWDKPLRSGKPVFAVLQLTPYEVKNGWLASRSIDDLLGCAISLETIRLLARERVATNVTVLLNRAEEVGFIGALEMMNAGLLSPLDSYLSIESSRQLPRSKPGKGPTIRLGDRATHFDANLVELLDQAADVLRKKNKKVQRLRLTGGTCEATAYQSFGLEAAGVAIPLVNYHNGWGARAVAPEMVRMTDIDVAVQLLVETAKLFPKMTLRGVLRDRLQKQYSHMRSKLVVAS
jgi:endoglucanase